MRVAIEQKIHSENLKVENEATSRPLLDECFAALGIGAKTPLRNMPFAAGDISAGSETELQAVVIGRRDQVDLPLRIEQSRYFSNLQRRTRAGEAPEKMLCELQDFLAARDNLVWENSWVRFDRQQLSHYARQVFEHDLLADKKRPRDGLRSDHGRFLAIGEDGTASLRVPVSYLVKLALADLLGTQLEPEHPLFATGEALMAHYLSDNTSPETFSFHVETLTPERGMGRGLANETARRFLFTQLLLHYANRLGEFDMPVLTTLAAISIAYAFGEGLGRLACISFGCCYGKPVKECSPWMRKCFARWNFAFHEQTRKIAYASQLEGEPVVPIQALTALLYVGCGLVGTYLFLLGATGVAFALMVSITQLWRVLSETQRADYRGDKRISAYQVMGILAIPYALLCLNLFPVAAVSMDLSVGLTNFWQPTTLFFLQLVGLVIFLYTGRSSVTGANLSYHVHHDRI